MTRPAQSGFTLIEALIALALLAITAVSFLRATEANIARVSALEVRAAGAWVAQNRLAEVALGLATGDAQVPMLGRQFNVSVRAEPTPDAGLTRLDIVASELDSGAGASLTGFVATGARP